jgi:hypothetical protein
MKFLENKQLNKITFHCIFILSVYAILFFIRLPILLNADFFLNSDEGFLANYLVDLINGGKFSFFYENVSYEGTLLNLIAIPFFWLFGISAFTFKLTAIFFYALYIWTFFLLVLRLNVKTAWISTALLVTCPPSILDLTTLNYSNLQIQFIGNVAFLIFLSNRKNPSFIKVFYINFLMGLSLYIYTYSIIFFGVLIVVWIIDAKFSFRNNLLLLKPTCFRECCARFADVIIISNFSWVLLTYMFGGISSQIGGLKLFSSFMRSNAPHYWMLDPSKVSIPFIEVLLFIIAVRVIVYRADIIYLIRKSKNSPLAKFIGVGLLGFFTGMSPRWIGLYRDSITGHPGYEVDLGFPQMWHKLSDLVSVQLPRILELNSYIGLLVTVLVGAAIVNFLRRGKGGVEMIFAILPIVLLLALIIYQKPNTARHIFPLYGVFIFYVASALYKVEKKSILSFWALFVFFGIYYGYATYDYYKNMNVLNGFQVIKKDSTHSDLIKYARQKQFDVVYTDYSAHKLQFLSGGNPSFVEFYRNPIRGWERIKQTANLPNFAVFISENSKNVSVYENFIKATKITCDRERVSKYLIFSKCRGPSKIFPSGALRYLRILAQREHAT